MEATEKWMKNAEADTSADLDASMKIVTVAVFEICGFQAELSSFEK